MVQPLEEQYQAEMGARLNPNRPLWNKVKEAFTPAMSLESQYGQAPPDTSPQVPMMPFYGAQPPGSFSLMPQSWQPEIAALPEQEWTPYSAIFRSLGGKKLQDGEVVPGRSRWDIAEAALDTTDFLPGGGPIGDVLGLAGKGIGKLASTVPWGSVGDIGGDILKMGPEIFGSMGRSRDLIKRGWMNDPKSQERIKNMAEKGITWPQGQTRKIGDEYFDETGRELGYTGELSPGWPSQGPGFGGEGARRTSEAELAGEGASTRPQNFYGRAAGQLNRHPFESLRSHWRRMMIDGQIETAELINQVIGWKSYNSPQDLVTKNTKNFDEIAKDLREGFHRKGPYGQDVVNGKFTPDFIKSKEDLIRRNEELLKLYREGTIGPGDVNTVFTLLRNSFVHRGEGLGDPIKVVWSPSLQDWGKYERGFFDQIEAITREKQFPKLPNLSWGKKSTTSSERLKNMTPEQRLRFKRIQEGSQEMLDDDYPTTGY